MLRAEEVRQQRKRWRGKKEPTTGGLLFRSSNDPTNFGMPTTEERNEAGEAAQRSRISGEEQEVNNHNHVDSVQRYHHVSTLRSNVRTPRRTSFLYHALPQLAAKERRRSRQQTSEPDESSSVSMERSNNLTPQQQHCRTATRMRRKHSRTTAAHTYVPLVR